MSRRRKLIFTFLQLSSISNLFENSYEISRDSRVDIAFITILYLLTNIFFSDNRLIYRHTRLHNSQNIRDTFTTLLLSFLKRLKQSRSIVLLNLISRHLSKFINLIQIPLCQRHKDIIFINQYLDVLFIRSFIYLRRLLIINLFLIIELSRLASTSTRFFLLSTII